MILALLLLSTVEAANVHTQAPKIGTNESVLVTVGEMPGAQRDWVAIYPAGAKSTFANIVAYKFTNGKVAGKFDLGRVPAGNYEARVYAANSWHPRDRYHFTVSGVNLQPVLSTGRVVYDTNEPVTVWFRGMQGKKRDWVAIFPIGAKSTFANIIAYKFTNGLKTGEINFGGLPDGNYEVRLFNANSWSAKASDSFRVEGNYMDPTIKTLKDTFTTRDDVVASFTKMPRVEDDLLDHNWVAIFPAGARTNFANIVKYVYLRELEGNVSLGRLPVGHYEVRSFFSNSWVVRASYPFTVE